MKENIIAVHYPTMASPVVAPDEFAQRGISLK
jgi:hypothetical protein